MTAHKLHTLLEVAAIIWLAQALCLAFYGSSKGHPWFPLFMVALAIGWPLPLLLVALAPRAQQYTTATISPRPTVAQQGTGWAMFGKTAREAQARAQNNRPGF